MTRISSTPPHASAAGAAPAPRALPTRTWWGLTLLGAALLTAFDAFLLQQKKAFFTGGFLSVDHAEGPAEIGGFVLMSFGADAAVTGLLMAAGLLALARVRLTSAARGLAVLMFALAPLVAADFLEYRLTAYLGDAFDLALMYDLTGRKASEIFVVAAPHLVGPGLALAGLVTAAAGAVWGINRLRQGSAAAVRVRPRLFLTALAVFLVVLGVTATARARSDMMDNGLRRKPSGKVLGWVMRAATDVDRDGYGIGGFFTDHAPFDSRLFPYALDHPGNGIDENGVGGDLPVGSPYAEPAGAVGPWRHRPDVVLIVLESFRGDMVGAIVNGRAVTPVLNDLAAGGVAGTDVFSHNGYTSQSRFHLLSGSLADLRGGRTLIDDFKANGYEVAYFSGQDESFGGLSVGFERAEVAYDARQDTDRRYTTFTTPGSLAVPFDVVHERVVSFVERRDGRRPLFLILNFHDTHYPYHHDGMRPLVSDRALAERHIGPSRADDLRQTYANAAANVDHAIGETLKAIRARLASPPAVIVTSDHGESLFDEGFLGHGYALNDAQTRIPLIVTGLGVTIEDPFGQLELRDAIGEALAEAEPGPPRLQVRADKRVFQYLGNLDRPRQIAFADGMTRTIYDFRTRQVRTGTAAWRDPATLDAADSERFLELVHFWERVVLARGQAHRGPDE